MRPQRFEVRLSFPDSEVSERAWNRRQTTGGERDHQGWLVRIPNDLHERELTVGKTGP